MSYPGGTAAAVKASIGGGVDRDWIRNTCVVRVSRSLNVAGYPISGARRDGLLTVVGGDGMHYALRVDEFARYLRKQYGPADVTHVPRRGHGAVPSTLVGLRGVIVFDVDTWSDATGHVDLWNGERCRHADDFDVYSKVRLWAVGDARARPSLVASVGAQAANRVEDVRLVQTLLRDRGVDPGRVDGVLARETVAAIREFQRSFMRRPDGRVDPNGRTLRELLGL